MPYDTSLSVLEKNKAPQPQQRTSDAGIAELLTTLDREADEDREDESHRG